MEKEKNLYGIKDYSLEQDIEIQKGTISLINMQIVSHVRLMPDSHKGKGCSIGFSAKMMSKITPNLIGVDIGCGMTIFKLGKDLKMSLEQIDLIIKQVVPSGFNPKSIVGFPLDRFIHEKDFLISEKDFDEKYFNNLSEELKATLDKKRIMSQLGTLGSGNHFIEIDKDDEGEHYLVIHSGSRGLGVKTNGYWQQKAVEIYINKNITKESVQRFNELKMFRKITDKNFTFENVIEKDVDENNYVVFNFKKDLKKYFEKSEDLMRMSFKNPLSSFKQNKDFFSKEKLEKMALRQEEDVKNYLNDMKVAQKYASENRMKMGESIVKKLGLDVKDSYYFESIHNFIAEDNIIRKGATSAHKDELLLIPLNMKEGTIIAKGLGNEDWNYSAPHGAGRKMSRTEAKKTLKLDNFVNEMEGIYSSTVGINTLDEAPGAYKDADVIIKAIAPTAQVLKIIKPIYNFKGIEIDFKKR